MSSILGTGAKSVQIGKYPHMSYRLSLFAQLTRRVWMATVAVNIAANTTAQTRVIALTDTTPRRQVSLAVG